MAYEVETDIDYYPFVGVIEGGHVLEKAVAGWNQWCICGLDAINEIVHSIDRTLNLKVYFP